MKKVLFIGVLLLMVVSVSQATPVYFSGNGHYYESVSLDPAKTWADARTEAQAMSYQGVQGDLVTINTQDERLFLQLNVIGTWSGWAIGAIGATITDSTAYWINDEGPVDMDILSWYGSEPGALDTVVGIGDSNYSNGLIGYGASSGLDRMVVEYPVPEPTTMGLLASGGLAVLLKRRKRK